MGIREVIVVTGATRHLRCKGVDLAEDVTSVRLVLLVNDAERLAALLARVFWLTVRVVVVCIKNAISVELVRVIVDYLEVARCNCLPDGDLTEIPETIG